MAYRFTGTDPFLRASPGAFVGYKARQSAISIAILIKRASAGAWMGGVCMDTGGSSVYHDWLELDPSNHIAYWNGGTSGGDISGAGSTALADTTNWEIIALTFAPASAGAAATPVARWKVGSAAWANQTLTSDSSTDATAIGSGYRWILGNEPGLGDDANYDMVCAGAYMGGLSQAQIESLTLTDFASWQAVFTGANAWLLGFDTLSSQSDRTGNGGNELSRSAGITLVSDPSGWAWTSGSGVTAPAGALTLSGAAPTLTASGTVTAPAGTLTLGASAPTLVTGTAVTAPAGVLTLGASAPTLAATGSVTAAAGALVLSGPTPTVAGDALTAPAGRLVLSGPQAAVDNGTGVTATDNPADGWISYYYG